MDVEVYLPNFSSAKNSKVYLQAERIHKIKYAPKRFLFFSVNPPIFFSQQISLKIILHLKTLYFFQSKSIIIQECEVCVYRYKFSKAS